jgi:PAS domain S-box-containing protein
MSVGHQASILVSLWQFTSSTLMYAMFCYLLSRQMAERKVAEFALEKITSLHEAIISGTRSGVVAYKPDGVCVLANNAAAEIVGKPKEQIFQDNFRELLSWKNSGLLHVADHVLQTDEPQRIELQLTTSKGKHLDLGANLCTFSMNQEKYLLMVFSDISEKVAAEKSILEAKNAAEAAVSRALMAERRVIDISEETQRRIGQELHDNLGQLLTGVGCLSESLFLRLKKRDLPEMEIAAMITEHIHTGVADTRALARGLYPMELNSAGLDNMIEQLAENVRIMHGMRCDFITLGEFKVADQHVAINLFRIAQEAINNVVKHSAATQIIIRAIWTADVRSLEIIDNGCGVKDWDALAENGGLGMHTMQSRANLIGAELLFSATSDGGARVAVSLPVEMA